LDIPSYFDAIEAKFKLMD